MSKTKGIAAILWSVLIISGSAYLGWGIYAYFWKVRLYNPNYKIVALVQTGPEKEALKTYFLAELLGLSTDHPTHLYKFDLKEGEKKLLAFPLIKNASLKRIPPGTLYIDYEIRKPVAFLGDFSNTAIGDDSTLIPFQPFFSPKKIPIFILGLQGEKLQWGDKLTHPRALLAMEVYDSLAHYTPIKIDVSKGDADSLGLQQILVMLEKEDHQTVTLILNPKNYKTALTKYALLEKEDSPLIDLRLDELAFIKRKEK